MSNIELYERLTQELLENPVIEEEQEVRDAPMPEQEELSREDHAVVNLEDPEPVREDVLYSQEEDIRTPASDRNDGQKMNYLESAVAERETLTDHLLWQARLSAADKRELTILETLITSLDEHGFLSGNLPEYAREMGIEEAKVAESIAAIQQYDPVGCGAAGVRESIEIQARHFFPGDTVLHRMVAEHFRNLEMLDYEKISKSLHVPLQTVMEKSQLIQGLDPYPGSSYSSGAISYVTPDLEVKLVGGEIIIIMNDEWIPRIGINPYYLGYLRKKNIEKNLKDYIQGKVLSAKNLMRNINGRRDTILKVVTSIMVHQKEFLEKGPGYLAALTHIDVARDTGFHESTVSRVTSNKYVQTCWGVHDLKFFFVSRIKSSSGDASADFVMKRMAELVEAEEHENPLSDEDIVISLSSEGINIARRTVAKYRNILNIPPSGRRKKLYWLKTEGNL